VTGTTPVAAETTAATDPNTQSAPVNGSPPSWLTPVGAIDLAQNGANPAFAIELIGSRTVVDGPYSNSGTPQGQVRLEAFLKVTNLVTDRSEETSWLGGPDDLAFFVDHKRVPGERCSSAFQMRYVHQSEISTSIAHFSQGTAGQQVDSTGAESLEPGASEEVIVFSAETVPAATKPSEVHLAYTSGATGVITSGGHPQKVSAGANNAAETVLLNSDGIEPRAEKDKNQYEPC
jgi:hypothetical protein